MPKGQFANREHLNQTEDWGSEAYVTKQLIQGGGSDSLVFTEVGYNIRIFLHERKLVSGYLLPISGNDLSFNYDFQRH